MSGALVIISCNESDQRVDPSRYFNLSASTTQVIKTAGGRTEGTVNNIHHADQVDRIGMIIVVQHISCAWSPGDVETNIRADIQLLRDSPYIRNEIPIIGYVLDTETSKLREVKYVQSSSIPFSIFQNPVMPLLWHATGDPSLTGVSPPRRNPLKWPEPAGIPRSEPDAEERQRVLNQMEDFGPFWN